MALTKQIVVDKIEVLEMGLLQVRTATRVLEDGSEISSSYHRGTLEPGQDLTGQDPKVVAIANATWTPEVISAYEAMLAALQSEMNTG
jgi:hypothetical protein